VHYSLYFPGAGGIDPRPHLQRCGLADLSRDKVPEVSRLDRGPGGKPGLLAAWRKGDAATDPPLALTDTQDWQPCRPSKAVGLAQGDYWVGIDRAKPPTPDQLPRKQQHAGYWIQLADGQQWHCPAAAKLPHRHGLAEDGSYGRRISPEFAAFFDQSHTFAAVMLQAFGRLELLQQLEGDKAPQSLKVDIDLAEAFAFCCQALALNYRLCPEIVDRLGLLNDDGIRNILRAAANLPVLIEVSEQKKKRSVSRSTLGRASALAARPSAAGLRPHVGRPVLA
jgi:hypothetical protein